MRICIVTGASSGMGRDFARELAKNERIDEMWIIARHKDRLDALAAELECPVRVLPMDLTVPESWDHYADLLKEEKPDVVCLVNSSGFGRLAHTLDVPLDVDLNMVDLNVKALTALCVLTVPYMDRGASIINMGSLSSFQPVPYVNVYAATKAYVLSFSRALNVELKPRGIRVIAVCPSWVKTEFLNTAVTDKKAVINFGRMWDSHDVVIKALKDLKKGKDVSVLGASTRFQVVLTRIFPHGIVMKTWMKRQNHDTP
ncbi:MAG: SDR family NAD(P)-dependent oxidoreductase [Candidatus Methanoplasma sp.]|nr:SDR family NAD(P)-dependent oxidoreductase [Candidatus Methanoplasma sp.]